MILNQSISLLHPCNHFELPRSDQFCNYEFISEEMKAKHSLVDVFSELCDYFNVNPTKFYQSLSNKFKEELIEELDERTHVLKRKNINRLF